MIEMHDSEVRTSMVAGRLTIERAQFIDADTLAGLASDRAASEQMRRGELNKVASVPVSLVDLWDAQALRGQGKRFHDMTAHEVVQRLRQADLHAFLATDGRV